MEVNEDMARVLRRNSTIVDDDDIMTDADFEAAIEALAEYADADTKRSIAQLMNESQIISWEEAEQMLCSEDEPIKSSLPQQTRPTEPDNDTDVDGSIRRLLQNDPKLVKVNLNNMKRTPIAQIKRVIEAMRDNEFIEVLSLANMGLRDLDVEPLIGVVEMNESLRVVNLETNYLSGEFFARLFQAALKNQTLEEVKTTNQGVNFSTQSERDMIKAVFNNRGLLKVSVNFRLPEGRHKIDQATMRNQEIRRVLRRQAAEEAKKAEQEALQSKPPVAAIVAPTVAPTKSEPIKPEPTKLAPTKPEPVRQPPKTPAVVIKTAPSTLATAGVVAPPTATPSTIDFKPPTVSRWRAPTTPTSTADQKAAKAQPPTSNAMAPMILADTPSSSTIDEQKSSQQYQAATSLSPSTSASKAASSSGTTTAASDSDSGKPKPRTTLVRKKKRVESAVVTADAAALPPAAVASTSPAAKPRPRRVTPSRLFSNRLSSRASSQASSDDQSASVDDAAATRASSSTAVVVEPSSAKAPPPPPPVKRVSKLQTSPSVDVLKPLNSTTAVPSPSSGGLTDSPALTTVKTPTALPVEPTTPKPKKKIIKRVVKKKVAVASPNAAVLSSDAAALSSDASQPVAAVSAPTTTADDDSPSKEPSSVPPKVPPPVLPKSKSKLSGSTHEIAAEDRKPMGVFPRSRLVAADRQR